MAIGVSILCILNYTIYLPLSLLFLVVSFLNAPVLAPGPGILSSVKCGIRAGLRVRLHGVFGAISKSNEMLTDSPPLCKSLLVSSHFTTHPGYV